jgi:hypothetical protein
MVPREFPQVRVITLVEARCESGRIAIFCADRNVEPVSAVANQVCGKKLWI